MHEMKTQPRVYEIKVEAQLDEGWSDYFDGLSVTHEDAGLTVLTGPVADQAALYGLLGKLRDLGLPLVSVKPVGT